MERLVELAIKEAPMHGVLPRCVEYDVREIRFNWLDGRDQAILELAASTHGDYAVLQFHGVEDLYIPSGDTKGSIRLVIQDTSKCPSRTHDILPVRVGGAGPEGSSLRFWAKSVLRVK